MKEKVDNAWLAFKWFCATQAQNFCVGMAISVLLFLGLSSCLPLAAAAALCPVISVASYAPMRYACGGLMKWGGDYGLRNSLIAVLLASLYVLLIVLI